MYIRMSVLTHINAFPGSSPHRPRDSIDQPYSVLARVVMSPNLNTGPFELRLGSDFSRECYIYLCNTPGLALYTRNIKSDHPPVCVRASITYAWRFLLLPDVGCGLLIPCP